MSTNSSSDSSGPIDFAKISASLGVLGWVALIAVVFAILVTGREAAAVIRVTLAADATSEADLSAGRVGIERYNASYERETTRIANRDMWNRPKAPPPPPPPPRPQREPEPDPGPPPAPPPPSIYGGPSIEAMMGGTVWFERGLRLSVGESNDEVEVISTRPPWSATLRWKDVEFEVTYFDREIPRFWDVPSEGPEFLPQPDPDPSDESEQFTPQSAEPTPGEPL